MSIKENLIKVKNTFTNPECILVAVSKTQPIIALKEAYDLGIRDFGENKVQEMVEKQAELPEDVRWHMIGHLQTKKVKQIVSFVHLIHGVDSLKLLKEINKRALKENRTIDCLLQIHIAKEESKFGLDENELEEIVSGNDTQSLQNIKIVGLMGMATYTENTEIIRKEFKMLYRLFLDLKKRDLPSNFEMKELSMGMSGDYIIAQEEGSTMVRIGTAIFGERNYK
ncbi:YggS family pyridoxal phosphate-dependent enzyme [Aquiflexum sp.]|uniref:YggS family pyridoxal phosphate-dependent enzyme n=1 Tax=Aquiflexum sp. TaxID=1872584 RepID=UPI0035949437